MTDTTAARETLIAEGWDPDAVDAAIAAVTDDPDVDPDDGEYFAKQARVRLFHSLHIPQVSYIDFVEAGGSLDAVRELSAQRVAALPAVETLGVCPSCGQPVTSGDAREYKHGAWWHTDHAEPEPTEPRTWKFHVHGENWSGANGTVTAKSAAEARRIVHDRYRAAEGHQGAGGSDDLGLYIRVQPPQQERST